MCGFWDALSEKKNTFCAPTTAMSKEELLIEKKYLES